MIIAGLRISLTLNSRKSGMREERSVVWAFGFWVRGRVARVRGYEKEKRYWSAMEGAFGEQGRAAKWKTVKGAED